MPKIDVLNSKYRSLQSPIIMSESELRLKKEQLQATINEAQRVITSSEKELRLVHKALRQLEMVEEHRIANETSDMLTGREFRIGQRVQSKTTYFGEHYTGMITGFRESSYPSFLYIVGWDQDDEYTHIVREDAMVSL